MNGNFSKMACNPARKHFVRLLAFVLAVGMLAVQLSGCFDIFGTKKVYTPYSAADCIGKNKDAVEEAFFGAGFYRVVAEEIADLEISESTRYGEIESVAINGVSDFEGNAEFSSSALVVIQYHSYVHTGVPVSSDEAKNMDTALLLEELEEAGFINITVDEAYDLDPDVVDAEYENEVSINGYNDFVSGEEYPLDAEIVITTHRPYEKYTLKVIVDFTANIIFSRYDVKLTIGDRTETMPHGKDAEFDYRLQKGKYTLVFEKAEDSSVKGSVDIELTGDTKVAVKITCHNDEVEVETEYIENQGAVGENEAMVPLAAHSCEYKDYKEVEASFKKAGFTNIKTKILYDIIFGITQEGEVEEVTINGDDDFNRGDIYAKNADVVITYHMKKVDDPSNKEETKPEDKEEQKKNITISNNTEFASLMKIANQTDYLTINSFVNKHIGDVLEFDGCIAFMMNHGSYKTRFDVCLVGGNYDDERVYGPMFAFEDVNFYDMNVSGTDTVQQGMNFQIIAEIVGFSEEGGYIVLKPVSLKAR